MSVPPEMMALLQGGGMGGDPSAGGAPMGGPPMGGPPMEAPPEEAGGGLYGGGAGVGGDNVEALKAAMDALQMYAEGEDDDQNIQVVLKCLTALQAIMAEEQKMMDSALGGKADPRALRKLGGAAGAGGPSY